MIHMSKPRFRRFNVDKRIRKFLGGADPEGRYASFDYCYNYFRGAYKEEKTQNLASTDPNGKYNMEKSCLHLGFYLASWGMYRGSTTMLWSSLRVYRRLVENVLAKKESLPYWEIDVDNYDEKKIKELIDLKSKIVECLETDETGKKRKKGNNKKQKNWDTLATKIMLGVFGNSPAFDSYFRSGMKVHSFTGKSLEKLHSFYEDSRNKPIFDRYSNERRTMDFETGRLTSIHYPLAKLIDMSGYEEGIRIIKARRKSRSPSPAPP